MYANLIFYLSILFTTNALTTYADFHHRYDHLDKLEGHDYWYAQIRLENKHFLNESTFDEENVPSYPFKLKIEKSSIPVLQVNTFKWCPYVKGVFLSDINITTISPGVFNGLQLLTEIDLAWNKLTQVEDGVFSDVQNLVYLDLSYNYIQNISEQSFSGLKHLNYLYLQGNEISLLYNNLFKSQVNSLLVLDISSNKLKEINTTFQGMSNLTSLYLQMNNISHVAPDAFKNVTSLQYLDVSHNDIAHINLDSGLEKLTDLCLQNNKISFLDRKSFDSQKKSIYTLNISSNNLKEIDTVFYGMSSLTDLYLQANNVSSLGPDSFQNLSSLQHLDLSHNSLRDLPEHVFSGSEMITHLYLQNNKLIFLDSYLFESQRQSLEFLNLSTNALKEIGTEFRGISHLADLYLQENQISSTVPHSFQGLSSLEYLDISHNNLELFQYGFLDHLDQLRYLNFSNNKFENFPLLHLSFLTSLEELVFENNKIKSLNETEITYHFPLLRKIDLRGNFKWSCTRLATFVKKLRSHNIQVLQGNYFTGDNVRGMACYENDFVSSEKDYKINKQGKDSNFKGLTNTAVEKCNNEINPKCSEKNLENLINVILEKQCDGNIFFVILVTIATVTLILMTLLQFFFIIKLKGKTREEHLELL